MRSTSAWEDWAEVQHISFGGKVLPRSLQGQKLCELLSAEGSLLGTLSAAGVLEMEGQEGSKCPDVCH